MQYTVRLLRGLGTEIKVSGDTFIVRGGEYRPRRESVSAGSSGTTLYFMTGLVSLSTAPVVVTGQKYFQRRPIGPLLRALEQLGVGLSADSDRPPISVTARRPTGGHATISGTLSQWLSGLILLAPFATGPSVIEVEGELNERPYVELTVRMMRRFGLRVGVAPDWRRFEIEPNQQATPTTITLPPDVGSAAFGLAAAALHPSDVLLRGMALPPEADDGGPTAGASHDAMRGLGGDHPEVHFLDIVRQMGLPMELDEGGTAVRVRHDGLTLRPTEVDCRDIPDMLPILSVLGSFADGETVLRNIGHVRLKESDRVSAMLQLNRLGGQLDVRGDELRIRGVSELAGAGLSSFNDHRVLMALAVAGSRARGATTLSYPNAYRISYPRFLDAMNTIGIPMSVEDSRPSTAAASRGAGSRTKRRQAAESAVGVDRQGPITELVERWVRERPDAVAIAEARASGITRLTWRELDERANTVAALLLKLGVRPGERVAYQLPNWSEFVVITLAALRVQAVCCPLMPIFREREMAFALHRSAARVLFVPDVFRGRDYRSEVAAVWAEASPDRPESLPLRHVVVVPEADTPAPSDRVDTLGLAWHDYHEVLETVEPSEEALRELRPTPDTVAQLLFTSGTSGEPKGALHTHRSLTLATAMEVRHLGLDDSDRIYIPTPLAHQTGFLYGMWLAFSLGVTQIIQPVWDATVGIASLRAERGTFVQAATPFLADMTKAVERGEQPPEALRVFVATGAAVPRALAERATRLLGTAVCGAWGTTETCLGTLSAPGDEPAKVWGTDGRPLEGISLRITDDAGTVLPPGTEGNFELHSPTFFVGYLDHPEWTAAAYTRDGWYRTGDLGIIDESGYIRITGRVKDVINRGGEKVPVAEVEQLLYQHPAVDDVAVVAMPDERLGERACAFVVLADGMDLDFAAMCKHLDSHQVAKHYWPERLEIIPRMPRNAAGKIQKFILREQAASLRPHREEERDS